MAHIDKRSITLSAELAAVVDDAVETGEYASASEVIRDALRQWQERRMLLGHTVEELRALWDEGVADQTSVAGPAALDELRARLLQRTSRKAAKA